MAASYKTSGKFPDAKGSGPVKFDDKARERYLNFIRTNGRYMRLAADAAGVNQSTARHYILNDPEFAEQFDLALETFNHQMERAAWERAVEGKEEDIVNKDGEIVGTKTVYSDRLMVELLKSNHPEKFRETKQLDINVKGGVLLIEPQKSSTELEGDLSQLSRDQAEMIEGD